MVSINSPEAYSLKSYNGTRMLKNIFLIILMIFSTVSPIFAEEDSVVNPYGYTIFSNYTSSGQPNISNPNRLINYGDRILIRTWGAINSEELVMVDADGTIFIPEVGPVAIIGKTLLQSQNSIKDSISQIYNDNVGVHATIADVKPISIFVTGNVNTPGRFNGNPTDTILDYINKAGGINAHSGSYREINILRNNNVVSTVDLYQFLKNGKLPQLRFKDDDVIFITDIKNTISVKSGAINNFQFELFDNELNGKTVINYAKPESSTTHAEVFRVEQQNRFVNMVMEDFIEAKLKSGDEVLYYNDNAQSTISVTVEGATDSQTQFSIDKTTSLKELLSFIRINENFADIDSIHIERKSVAISQKEALNNSLFRLQQSTLRIQPKTEGETKIRTAEAEMINNFVETAKTINFPGKVIINNNGKKNDIILEEGDKIIIPQKTNVIMISGEVLIPNAFIYSESLRVKDYIFQSGGFTDNADPNKVVINHRDGTATIGNLDSEIKPGDNVIIMPKIDEKEFIYAKELIGVIYQLAVGANILLSL